MISKSDGSNHPIYSGLSCAGCPLERAGRGFSLPDGHGGSGVLALGEALGDDEARLGKPFVGRAGRELDKALWRLGVSRKSLTLHNVLACQPPGNVFDGRAWQASRHCRQYLERLAGRRRPRVLLLLGGKPLKAVLGLSGIDDARAPKRGYVYRCEVAGREAWAVPTIHPSFILRGNTAYAAALMEDIERARLIAREGWKYEEQDYHWQDEEEFFRFKEAAQDFASDTFLAADLENDHSAQSSEEETEATGQIVSMSFCFGSFDGGGYAVSIPFDRFREECFELMNLPWRYVAWWNGWKFDLPLLREAGFEPRRPQVDAMWLWHFVQPSLRMGLGFVAPFWTRLPEWKSQGEGNGGRPSYYACADAHATWLICDGCERRVEEEGRWGRFFEGAVERRRP